MPWKRCLYMKQNYPPNYMEISHQRKRRYSSETYEDINRMMIRVSIVMLGFSLFRTMAVDETAEMPKTSWFSFISAFTDSFLESKRKTGINLKPSFMMLMLVYLMSPLIHNLAVEIHPTTFYFYFAITQILFIVDSVSSSIYNSSSLIEIKDEKTPLLLEESINIPKKISSNQALGLTSYFLGFILLSSRLKSPSSVFNFLCLTFIGYVIFPNYIEKTNTHKKPNMIMLIYVAVSMMSVLPSIPLFCLYSCVITFMYTISYISIWIFERELNAKVRFTATKTLCK
ncbi:hypothetical protein CWI42_030760 [Ordospora colligata]|uniref:Phosphatidylinositol N-acetylglucosaminyltransferase n=1 Tax=Ordospora colligata OC4 TaxID=1354746 RepID=A0A0B2UG49_9MICR|nr:uncharacterized protein M896_030470 [Ordospora colligata OC4]KHN70061.1 hypothetical protein M896_030470 [Ordospora colligata OC4]TBU16443.1 hypothetical protein CWI41_030430 [Ordospora colligata]TBU16628.1 hypothetical protein CWI40_030830 [Ordospora colligata]TBU19201.1 hypothetical protein CWI42_030760 [Ordospora colligata]